MCLLFVRRMRMSFRTSKNALTLELYLTCFADNNIIMHYEIELDSPLLPSCTSECIMQVHSGAPQFWTPLDQFGQVSSFRWCIWTFQSVLNTEVSSFWGLRTEGFHSIYSHRALKMHLRRSNETFHKCFYS